MNSRYLYLTIDLLTISVPLIASFYPGAPFYKKWRYLFPAIAIPAVVFLVWDELFTQAGIWGFNPRYLTGIHLGSLPLEEVLFFICIPYACVFTYFALKHLIERDILFPHQELISSALVIAMLVIGIHHIDRAYTGTTFVLLGGYIAFLLLVLRVRFMGRFYLAFAVTLIPFFIVNGLLTGSFIEDEVVWYNDNENMATRIGTIPVEDIFYGMLLLLSNVSIFEWLQQARWFNAAPAKLRRERA